MRWLVALVLLFSMIALAPVATACSPPRTTAPVNSPTPAAELLDSGALRVRTASGTADVDISSFPLQPIRWFGNSGDFSSWHQNTTGHYPFALIHSWSGGNCNPNYFVELHDADNHALQRWNGSGPLLQAGAVATFRDGSVQPNLLQRVDLETGNVLSPIDLPLGSPYLTQHGQDVVAWDPANGVTRINVTTGQSSWVLAHVWTDQAVGPRGEVHLFGPNGIRVLDRATLQPLAETVANLGTARLRVMDDGYFLKGADAIVFVSWDLASVTQFPLEATESCCAAIQFPDAGFSLPDAPYVFATMAGESVNRVVGFGPDGQFHGIPLPADLNTESPAAPWSTDPNNAPDPGKTAPGLAGLTVALSLLLVALAARRHR